MKRSEEKKRGEGPQGNDKQSRTGKRPPVCETQRMLEGKGWRPRGPRSGDPPKFPSFHDKKSITPPHAAEPGPNEPKFNTSKNPPAFRIQTMCQPEPKNKNMWNIYITHENPLRIQLRDRVGSCMSVLPTSTRPTLPTLDSDAARRSGRSTERGKQLD